MNGQIAQKRNSAALAARRNILGIICAAFCSLAGCAAAPQVIEKPVEVRVPVAVPCKTAEIPEPDWPLAKVPETTSDFEWFRAALAELALRAGYEVRLRAAVATCQ
ncbi:hypothetical protein [Cupriavidus basilensis]|uniref:hypothetical protein n=1 Tax=Cupriavidus basilensis TaxID=68895 RepID=UPI001F461847|nr:hypothetical protein [Cupriavidus basilensis]